MNYGEYLYYLWATLLVLAAVAAWLSLLLTLPGNWFIVALAAVFALVFPSNDASQGISWLTVAALLLLAAIGELVEFAASAGGAARQGASRRAMVLAIVGAFAGSLIGLIIGVPIPIIGSLVAAVGGGALGAFLGAYLGETWKGKSHDDSVKVSQAALIGRLLGTLGKLAVGVLMVVILAADAFVTF